MGELFTTSGEKEGNVVTPTPQLQGLFLPGIDNPQAIDGFGIITPWGGGSGTRRYNDYGISSSVSNQSTQLYDLASSLVPAEGSGVSYNFEGLIGPRGLPGKDGTTTILHEYTGLNSNYLTALPHNLDSIDDLGTAVDKLIYTDTYSTTYLADIAWTERQPVGDANKNWFTVASDSDGSHLIAGEWSARLWTSADSGGTWTERQPAGDNNQFWRDVASDADGSHLIAGAYNERLWTSANYGVDWTERKPAGDVNQAWAGNGSDSDGSHLIAGVFNGRLWTSANYGVNWTERKPGGDTNLRWLCAASDADGSHLIAGESGGLLWTSADSGATWIERTPAGAGAKFWRHVASDSDGSHLIAGIYDGRLYTSANYGVNWTERKPAGNIDQFWYRVASDSDGSNLIAGAYSGRLWTSADSGATWIERRPAGDVTRDWGAVASDADGVNFIVGAYGKRLYTGAGTTYSEATWAETTLTSAGRALLDDTTAAAMATTLGLGTGDSPTFTGLTLSGLTDDSLIYPSSGVLTSLGVATNGQLPIGSTGVTPVLATISGTTDHISVVNGAGSITLNLDTNTQTLLGSFNGIFLEKLNFTISEAGGTVTGSLEQDGGGDLIQRFSDGYTTLDCTPAKTIDLTAYVGTDAVPKEVFIYILQSAKTTIVASNTDWPLDPEVEHIKIAHLVLKSAVTTGTDGGALMNQNHNDYAFDATGEGHLQDIEHRLRQEPAIYHSGVALTLKNAAGAELTTTNSSTAVELVTATGHVFQIHQHNFPAFDMYTVATDKADIVNQPTDEGGGYETTVDLVTDITHYVDGTAAGVAIGVNKYFNIVIWGVMNRAGETSFLMINLPTGQYTTSGNAIADVDGTSVFEIPSAFKGVGFLIARLTFRLIGGSQWTYIAQEDLRGKFPDIIAGVGITTTDHALLANLIAPADDHTQYLLADGTRALAGAWDMGSQALTNVNIDSGVITGITDLAVADGGTGASTAGVARTNLGLVIGTDVQAYDAGLLSLAGLTYASASFVKMTGANTFALRTIGETADDLQGTIDHDLTANYVANKHIDWTSATESLVTTGTVDASGFQIIAVFAQVDIQSSGNRAVIICDGSTGNDADIVLQENHVSEWVIKHDSSENSQLQFIQKPGDDLNVLVLQQDGSVILPSGPLFIKEQAAADGDTAAYGQLWVRNDAPNILMFTDDVGTDFPLVSPSYIKVVDTKAQDANGGTFTSGSWQTRDLNSKPNDTDNHCTLAANQITLTAGTYECRISCPAYKVNFHQAILYNTTGATTLLTGTSENAGQNEVAVTRSFIVGRFTVAASQALEIQHQGFTTGVNLGFGVPSGFTSEIYTIAEFWKVG